MKGGGTQIIGYESEPLNTQLLKCRLGSGTVALVSLGNHGIKD
jgi:hypothetical protein